MAKFKKNQLLASTLIALQLAITVIFFIGPAGVAIWQAFHYSDPFGVHERFAGLAQFREVLTDPSYYKAFGITVLISCALTLLTMGCGILFSSLVVARVKSQWFYKTMMIWPYAVAPAVGALLWRFLCHPTMGWFTLFLKPFGVSLNYYTSTVSALFVVILVGSWQQFSYNFLFYLTALNAIPRQTLEAATLDGANAWQKFWQITWPLLAPTSFFLLTMNLIYGFFETFGIIHVITNGGPGTDTTTLMYKLYEDGFVGMDFGSAATQSVLLMVFVMGLTLIQFKVLERRVHFSG